MKLSMFNTVLPYENSFILFNTLNKSSMLIDEFLKELLEYGKKNNDIIELKKIHPEFYNELLKMGFIISSKKDEIEDVKKLMNFVNEDDSSFYLIVNPTMNCNFKCWYCYETHIKDSKMSNTNLNKIKNLISNKTQDNKLKTFTLAFFGGEPLLYYKQTVLPLMEYCYPLFTQNNIHLRIFITTNGFLINDEMIKDFRRYNVSDFQITLDGDEKSHNKVRYVTNDRGSYKEIIGNIIKLVKNNFHITMRINYTTENIGNLNNILKDLSELSIEERKLIFLSLNKVWQETDEGINDVAVEFKRKSADYGFNIPNDKGLDVVNNPCYADKRNQVTVNYNGEIYKCNARDFKTENKLGVLDDNGEMVWNDLANIRSQSRLTNKPCLKCSILPICGGGCSQLALEYLDKDYCVHNFDEESKMQTALKLVLASI